jgi:hypothetical protein
MRVPAARARVRSGDKGLARPGMAPALDVRWLQPGRRLAILTADRLVRPAAPGQRTAQRSPSATRMLGIPG